MTIYAVIVPSILLLAGLLLLRTTIRFTRASRAEQSRPRRLVTIAALALVTIAILAIAGTSTWNAIAVHRYRASHAPSGTIYTIDGHKMRIDCTGRGEPTLILDAGLGNDGLIWGTVQPTLSRLTRVCSYDRAGFGWSDLRTGPQDADRITEQLRGLLQEARISGPIVLMAHSIAGIYIRDYANRHPQGIVGLVFVDASTPLQEEHGSAALRAKMQNSRLDDLGTRAIFALGLPRLIGQCSQKLPGFTATASQSIAENLCLPWSGAAIADEMASFHRSGLETIHTGPYGDLPVLIFSHDPLKSNSPGPKLALAKEHETVWNDMQEDLKKLSTRSRRVIAKGSGHYVQIERTDLVNREVAQFIRQIRDGATLGNAGATQIE